MVASSIIPLAATPVAKRLEAFLSTVKQPPSPPPDTPEDAVFRHYEDQHQQCQHLAIQISSAVAKLTEYHDKWVEEMKQLSPTEKQSEIAEYQQSQKSGFLEVWERGQEAENTMFSYLKSIEHTINALGQQQIAKNAHTANTHKQLALRLPKLELKVFNGNSAEWPTFWAWFDTAIHTQPLTEVEKLTYLKSCMSGKAAELVNAYSLNTPSYTAVLDRLKVRYGNRNEIIQKLYTDLEKLPYVKEGHQLRDFVEELERILTLLEHQGEQINNMMVQRNIERHLPRWILLELEKQKGITSTWTVVDVRQNLNQIALTHESVSRSIDSLRQLRLNDKKESNRSDQWEHRNDSAKGHSSAMVIARKQESKMICAFCNRQHWSDKCRVYFKRDAREKRASELRLCLRCLKKGHMANVCRGRNLCYHCKKQHHTALCSKYNNVESNAIESVRHNNANKRGYKESSVNATTEIERKNEKDPKRDSEKALLMCITVKVSKPDRSKTLEALVFLDSGSQQSFVTTQFAKKLSLPIESQQQLNLVGFGTQNPKEYQTAKTRMLLERTDGDWQNLNAFTIKHITKPLEYVPKALAQNSSIINLKSIPNLGKRTPDILIGVDQMFYFVNSKNCAKEITSGFQLFPTTIGNIITGKGKVRYSQDEQTVTTVVTTSVTNETDEQLKKFWELESIGITDTDEPNNDELVQQTFDQTVEKLPDGRYQVGWPWKENAMKALPNNFGLSIGRLRSTWKKLKNNPDLLQAYHETFMQQLRSGIIEKTDQNMEHASHFLPHQAVLTPNKTSTKLRIVFDASAKSRGQPSLNDQLFRGPVILPSLVGVLMRWRNAKICVIADLEKAFHQLSLREPDRNFTKFIWLKNPLKPPEGDNIIIYRFARVLFGVVSSPFLLAATVKHHLNQIASPLSMEIENNIYVDNVFLEAENAEEAIKKYRESKQYFSDAKMNLRDFLSNDPSVNKIIDKADKQKTSRTKVLGIDWDTEIDQITFNLPDLKKVIQTKRSILSAAASIYDPLGLLAPIVVPLKGMLQLLWKKEYRWDQLLAKEESEVWQNVIDEWNLTEISLPRHNITNSGDWDLHAFVDASKHAYAAVVYMRQPKTEKQQALVNLTFAKTRMTPIKGLSIPRLELLAVLIGVRALNFVKKQLNYEKTPTVWSDSQPVLHWIHSDKEQCRFVENRLKELRRSNVTFKYVPTAENPADIASRGCSPEELRQSELWWHGPKWLTEDESKWPQWSAPENKKTDHNDDEICEPDNEHIAAAITQEQDSWIQTTRFRSWTKLHGTVSRVLYFIEKLKRKSFKSHVELREPAELLLIKMAQEVHIETIKKLHLKEDSKGLLRYSGRMEHSTTIQKSLLYLSRESYITKLLIEDAHKKVIHGGIPSTLSKFKEKFWTERSRSAVKSVLRQCARCRKWKSKPFALPEIPPYPAGRVSQTKPFSHVGMDYMGPIKIKAVKGKPEKRWIALFTCFSTRAVHLEVAENLTAESCLHVLRRFAARRGAPTHIYSDNGTQLKLVAQTLEKAQNDITASSQYLQNNSIRWEFITPQAPWKGGVYERMVGLVKESMRKAIGRKFLTDGDLATLCTEVESVVNTRPLTYIDDETTTVLRPVDFLMPAGHMSLPLIDSSNISDPAYDPKNSSRSKLLQNWINTTNQLQRFWDIWSDQYLELLRDKARWMHNHPRSQTKRTPIVGEIVLIKEEDNPRGCWPLGKILKLLGSEGQIRSAQVKLASGRELLRPINFLYPLELNIENEPKPRWDSHPVDPNLEQEEEEEEDEDDGQENVPQIALSVANSVSKRDAPSFKQQSTNTNNCKVWPFLVFVGMLCLTAPIQARDCTTERTKVLMQIPKLKNCSAATDTGIFKPVDAVATIYEPIPLKIRGFVCVNITRVICTDSLLVWRREVTQDEMTIEGVPTDVCYTLKDNKHIYINGEQLNLVSVEPSKWKTQKPVSFGFGWFGTRCRTTYNFLLEETQLVSYDHKHFILDLGDEQNCEIERGKCIGSRGTAIWNITDIHQCLFRNIGEYKCTITSAHIKFPELQMTLVQAKYHLKIPHECSIPYPITMENGYIVSSNVTTLEEQTIENELDSQEHADQNNPRYQFIYDSLKTVLSIATEESRVQRCHLKNNMATVIEWISKTDPTTAAKILLERNDVRAVRVGESTLMVSHCEGSPPIEAPEGHIMRKEKGVVFNTKPLFHWEVAELKYRMESLQKSAQRSDDAITGKTKREENMFDKIRDKGEEAIIAIQAEMGKTANEIKEEAALFVYQWKWSIISSLGIILFIAGVAGWCWLGCPGPRCRCRRHKRDRANNITVKYSVEKKVEQEPVNPPTEISAIEIKKYDPLINKFTPLSIPRLYDRVETQNK